MKTRSKLFVGLASLVLLVLLLDGRATAADGIGCTVSEVQYDSTRLKVVCSGVEFYTNPGGSCHTTGIDDVKVLESIAMAAFLSGKLLDISFESGACVSNAIYSIKIR